MLEKRQQRTNNIEIFRGILYKNHSTVISGIKDTKTKAIGNQGLRT